MAYDPIPDKPDAPIRQAVDRADAICQEQAGDEVTVETGYAAISQFGLSTDELADVAIERTRAAVADHGDDPVVIGTMMFASAFMSGVVYGRSEEAS